ncbi:MAG: hypothetical protein IJ228_07990 [Succinivibrio sp.]|nr:hypothetical protein [Succinivibrio sp.]
MRQLKLTAVGSSALVAREIAALLQSMLPRGCEIGTALTEEVDRAQADTFYVCAGTQRKALLEVLPPEVLYVLDLEPSTRFFLALAQLPPGSEVVIFNNRLPYTTTLKEKCRALGLGHYHFVALAFEEMPHSEVRAILSEARYIMGVSCFTGEEALLSDNYRDCLRKDVRIIDAQRAASLPSAARLLGGIALFGTKALEDAASELQALPAEQRESAQTELLARSTAFIAMLKQATLRALTTLIEGSFREGGTLTAQSTPLPQTVEGCLAMLGFLRDRLDFLGGRALS